MDMILLNLRPERDPEERAETVEDEPAVEESGSSFAGGMTERILEHCNPFEALGCVLEDPRAAVGLFVFFGVVILAAIILGGLWSAVQEALSGGGSQGFGLR